MTAASPPARFLAACARHPERTAIVDGSIRLTYAELAAAAGGLAAELRRRGVARGEFVGLRAARSAEVWVAVIGILLTGAAYVPLDPAHPAERRLRVRTEAGIRFVVGGDGDDGVPVLGHPACAAEPPVLDPDDVAYVLYTSGSTGRPKGCMITHGNVTSLLDGALPLFDVGRDDRWALFHSVVFDISVWELWSALTTGAAVVVVDDDAVMDPYVLLDLLVRERVTVLNQVPPVFRVLVEAHADAGRPPLSLRHVVFGGDRVDLDVVAAFLAGWSGGPPPSMVNMYGITETTVHVTYKLLDDAALHGPDRSPIGRALPHLAVSLRDDDSMPVADGETGEMWVSGGGVGAGYLGRPDLTAQRFVTVDGVRHYRSGDLARRGADGELHYLGRADRQVKLRGLRIELGEIEAVLRGCDGVRDAVVNLEHDPALGDLLVAHVVAPGRLDEGPLKAECRRLLPPYMEPARFVPMLEVPLSPTGKLDRTRIGATSQS